MSASLHPQNDRPGAGVYWPPLPAPRFPPVYITEHGEVKHETPLCPHVKGHVHRSWCPEEALYVFGERRCETCRDYCWDIPGTGWTDPRFREADR